MNLLFLTQTFPRFAGDTAGPFIRDLALALVRGGDQVTVLVPHAAGVEPSRLDGGVRVVSFRYAPERWELVGYSRSLEADERMRTGALAVSPLYLLGAVKAVRRLLRQERFDLLQGHWVVPNGLVAAAFASQVRVAIGLHGSDVFVAEKPGVRSLVALALRRTALLTGCSPELVDRVRNLGFDASDYHVIPYGVDPKIFRPRERESNDWRSKLGIGPDDVVLLSVGRMATKKGYQVLLPLVERLFEGHPGLHLVLAGGGDRLREFESMTRGLERVHYPGPIGRQDLPGLYQAADLFVLPAVHDPAGNVDGLPNVILEAMASGLPVIASEISGIPLAVEHEETGLLVPEQNAGALLEALERLLRDRRLARAMGVAGRLKVEKELTWSSVAARYREAYGSVLTADESN